MKRIRPLGRKMPRVMEGKEGEKMHRGEVRESVCERERERERERESAVRERL